MKPRTVTIVLTAMIAWSAVLLSSPGQGMTNDPKTWRPVTLELR